MAQLIRACIWCGRERYESRMMSGRLPGHGGTVWFCSGTGTCKSVAKKGRPEWRELKFQQKQADQAEASIRNTLESLENDG